MKLLLRSPTPDEQIEDDRRRNASVVAETELRRGLDANYAGFLKGNRGAQAFIKYCDGLMRAVRDVPDAARLEGRRQKILGNYFEAGMKARKKPGADASEEARFFLHMWFELYWKSNPAMGSRTPAKQIAQLCTMRGIAVTPEQVRDAIRKLLAKREFRKPGQTIP